MEQTTPQIASPLGDPAPNQYMDPCIAMERTTPQIAPLPWEIQPPTNTWILGPPNHVRTPNGTSMGSAVFVQLTVVTDRHTDHETLVTTGGILCCEQQCHLIISQVEKKNTYRSIGVGGRCTGGPHVVAGGSIIR